MARVAAALLPEATACVRVAATDIFALHLTSLLHRICPPSSCLCRPSCSAVARIRRPPRTHSYTHRSIVRTDTFTSTFSPCLKHGYPSQRQEGLPQERLQVREGWPDLPGGPRRCDDAPRSVRPPHWRLRRRVPDGRAGVPDCGAAGAVREGGRAEREEAVPSEPAHRDAGRAPRRRHRHASEERDPVPQRRGAEHQQGDGEEEGRQEGQGDAECLDLIYFSFCPVDGEGCTCLCVCTT
ncbi:histone H2A, putative [Leishmania tarentolae]|uniref:Histone H2A, putative n=1 Tax=Leishmania tarentolae TaxID=5689 RepID=A0A640KMH0_LEITA|nr:histone H2A, putative [Leishmania tarentolae]